MSCPASIQWEKTALVIVRAGQDLRLLLPAAAFDRAFAAPAMAWVTVTCDLPHGSAVAEGQIDTRGGTTCAADLCALARRLAALHRMQTDCRSARSNGWAVSVRLYGFVAPAAALAPAVAWSRRLLPLVSQLLLFRQTSLWISTLGGAYSALASSGVDAGRAVPLNQCQAAQRAESLAWQQCRLALAIGDKSLVARCIVFVAISAMQQGMSNNLGALFPMLFACQLCYLHSSLQTI